MVKSQKLQNLEEKLGIAAREVEVITEKVEAMVPEIDPEQTSLVPYEEPPVDENIFELSQLKADFQIVRRNLLKLINTGQNMLDQAGVLDISDLKSSQLEALATLQTTIGSNINLMTSVYKDMCIIEKARRSLSAPTQPIAPGNVNMGTVNNTQVVFNGSTLDLLNMIKENANKS